MIRSLKRALQPAITDVSVLFQVPKEYEVLQSPHNLPPIFNGEKLVVYGVLKSKGRSKKTDCTAVLKGNMVGEKQEHKVPFTLDSSAATPSLPVVHHLAAKALIADWESEYKEKKSIVDLSIESSVISSHTAFIAIDEESSEPVSGAMKTYDISAMPLRQSQMPVMRMSMGAAMPLSKMRRGRSAPKAKKLDIAVRSADSSASKGRVLSARSRPASEEQWEGMASLGMPLRSSFGGGGGGPPPPPLSRGAGGPPPPPPGAPVPYPSSYCNLTVTDRVSTDPLTSLITAQQVNGSWALNASLAQLMGKSLQDLESACPIEMEEVAGVWATVLAVSLLRARYSSQQDEWELIAMKAESWLKKQSLPPGCTLEQLFQAAQKLF